MKNLNGIKTVHLLPWMEVIGELQKVRLNNNILYVKISGKTFEFEVECIETLSNLQKMLGNHVGKEISLLKTNTSKNPFLVQSIFEV